MNPLLHLILVVIDFFLDYSVPETAPINLLRKAVVNLMLLSYQDLRAKLDETILDYLLGFLLAKVRWCEVKRQKLREEAAKELAEHRVASTQAPQLLKEEKTTEQTVPTDFLKPYVID